ncbi:MAG: peptide-methionine (S)-S-oxide reductase MsrA [Hyphomonadaceae bacterium]
MIRFFVAAVIALFAGTGAAAAKPAQAVFAGGCFWCVEHDFKAVPGVSAVLSGYTGGALKNPTYKDVLTEKTGHYEAVRVTYDDAKITYAALVERYWRLIDPTDAGGQFCDRGPSYRSAIFATPEQRPIAEASKARLASSGKLRAPIVTQVLPLGAFYPAEEYHRDYARRNKMDYMIYRTGCGRDARLKAIWK